MKLNIGRSLGYAGGEYSSLRSSAVQIFTKVADDNDATAEDVVNAYVQANEARRRQQAQLKTSIDAALGAGMNRGQVMQALKNTGVSQRELSMIMNNRYEPIRVSRALIREVSDEVNLKKESRILRKLPMADITKAQLAFRNSPIVPTGEERPIVSSDGLFDDLLATPSPVTVAPASPPAAPSVVDTITSVPGSIVDSAAGIGTSIADTYRRIAPSILGGDRAAQSANEEILRRQQSGQ
jgi:hypothetical protein